MRADRALGVGALMGALIGALTLGVALGSAPALARVPRDPAAVFILRTSDSLFFAGRLDAAAAACGPLERRARAAHDRNTLLECRLRDAAALVAGNRLVPGEAAAREGLALAEALADSANVRRALRWLGYSFLQRTRLEEAATYYRRLLALAVPAGDQQNAGLALGSLAYRDLLAGRLADAERGYRMASASLDSAHDTRDRMWTLVGLARVQADLGEFPAARASYLAIAAAAAASGARASQADALNNLGTLEYKLGDPARAEAWWRQAVALYQSAGAEPPRLSTEINLCIAAEDLGRTDEAASGLAHLAAVSAVAGFRAQETSALNELAELRLGTGRPLEAAGIFRRILAANRPEETVRVSLATRGLARALAAGGDPAQALVVLERGAVPLEPRLAASEALALEIQRGRLELACGRRERARARLASAAAAAARAGLTLARLEALVGAGECERALGRLAPAESLLREAEHAWEDERRVPSDPEWRVGRGQLAEALCFDLAEVVFADSAAREAPARTREAYDVLQRFKARTLLERLTGPAGTLPSEAAREPVTLATVQARVLGPDELLLDAFVGTHDALLFAVTREACRMLRLPDAAVLGERVHLLHALDASRAAGASESLAAAVRVRAARALGRDVLGGVADLLAHCRRVIVAADGPLIALPFESLPITFGAGTRESTLIAAREVTRVPSISLLARLRARPARSEVDGLLVCDASDSGAPLPAAIAEARWLERRYADTAVRGGRQAHDTALGRATLAHQEVLHFAAHARVDDQRPWNSAVITDVTDGGGRHALTAASIASSPLDARLAVLAGCETAGGRVVWGEGVEGLSAAFLAAGVPAVVATLWPVDDAASAQFTRAFYGALERQMDVAAALRVARLALAAGPHAGDAAAFVVIGDGDVRVHLHRRLPLNWLAIAAGVLAAAAAASAWAQRTMASGRRSASL